MSNLEKIISNFGTKRILVIGDIILDQYIQGSVSRISPEAPVPVVLEEKSFSTPGGSANVSHNLSSLGVKVTQVGKIGDDREGDLLVKELEKLNIDTSGVFKDKNIPTPLKTRIIAQNQQVVRVDREKIVEDNVEINAKIVNFIEKNIDKFDAVVISDYGKGVVVPELVSLTSKLARERDIVITVDPKVEHFNYYKNVTAITPNKKEAENAIRSIKITESKGSQLNLQTDKLSTIDEINKAGEELLKFLDLESLLVTLGEQGMCLFEKTQEPYLIPTKAKEVFDVSGAGDTVISVFTLALTSGATKKEAAELANLAAGVVVGKMGAVAITVQELSTQIQGH
jgi:rfaE bifunctional protein kinase chain/domain